jgi:presenilin-like A22 family membrane protease
LIKIVGNRGIAEILLIFAVVMFAGLGIAYLAVSTSSISILYDSMESQGLAYASYAIDVALGAIILMLIARRGRSSNRLLIELLESIVIAFTSFFVLLLVFGSALPSASSGYWIYIAAAVLAILLAGFKERFVPMRNLATIVSSIGIGIILGFNLNFDYAILILAAVAVYDYTAVFRTDKMVSMAKSLAKSNMAFLVSVSDIEDVKRKKVSSKEAEEYMGYLKKSHYAEMPKYKKIIDKGDLPILSQISLGEGDLSLPLMVVISAYYFLSSEVLVAMVLCGAFAGIGITMAILKLYKHPLPAVPPLFALISIFSGVALLASGIGYAYAPAVLIAIGAFVMLVDMLTIVGKMHET